MLRAVTANLFPYMKLQQSSDHQFPQNQTQRQCRNSCVGRPEGDVLEDIEYRIIRAKRIEHVIKHFLILEQDTSV